ncbi:MAG: ribosomal protein S18-alanine N-acetyltransferase [Clostridia bacterium]|nr:ribosomal protein S18-alanine N-acetyltransferase [Clostridia bacterium]
MIEYVPMKREHLEGLVGVEEQCFNSGFARATFQKEFENKIATYFVAVEDEKVLGYAGLWNICGAADIIDVAVHKDFRRRGIAQNLISCLIEFCNKEKIFEINLEVRVSNIAAISLYEKMGFVQNGLRKNYYENHEDAYLMQRKFEEENNEDTCH